jgi:hypothetical protein
MTVRRFAPVPALVGLFGLLVSATPVGAQDPKAKPATKTGLDETTAALMAHVEEAFKAKDFRHDPKHGDGKNPFDQMPAKPGILIGLDVWPGTRDKTVQYVRGVRPIFLCADGKKYTGKIVGYVGTGSVKLEAKPGYAVAGMKVHTDFGELSGIALVFAKITETGLDTGDTEESKYLGHNDPNTARKVACTGEPVLGIHGLVAANAKSHDFGLGLTVMGKDKKKKEK